MYVGNRKRNIPIYVRVTENEKNQILDRMARIGISDMSAYMRKAAIDVSILHVNTDGLHELSRQVSLIGNNINQIARRCNQDGAASKGDIDDLRHMLDGITEIVNKYYDDISYIKKQRI
jgi:hypothetical protein